MTYRSSLNRLCVVFRMLSLLAVTVHVVPSPSAARRREEKDEERMKDRGMVVETVGTSAVPAKQGAKAAALEREVSLRGLSSPLRNPNSSCGCTTTSTRADLCTEAALDHIAQGGRGDVEEGLLRADVGVAEKNQEDGLWDARAPGTGRQESARGRQEMNGGSLDTYMGHPVPCRASHFSWEHANSQRGTSLLKRVLNCHYLENHCCCIGLPAGSRISSCKMAVSNETCDLF